MRGQFAALERLDACAEWLARGAFPLSPLVEN